MQEDALATASSGSARTVVELLAVPTDVSDEASVQAWRTATIERFGSVQVCGNNAGVSGRG